MRGRLAILVLLTLASTIALAPAAEASDCVAPPPVCPPGSVPWPRASGGGCGGRGVAWTCAWLG